MKKLIISIVFFFLVTHDICGQKDAFEEFNEVVFSHLERIEKVYNIPSFDCSLTNEIRFYIYRSGQGIEKEGMPGVCPHNIVVVKQDKAWLYSAYEKNEISFDKNRFTRKFRKYNSKADSLSSWNLDPNYGILDLDLYHFEIFVQFCKNDIHHLNYFIRGLGIINKDVNTLNRSKLNLKYMNKIIDLFYSEFELPAPMFP